jgi:predicted amino acid dehydrogenase
MLSDKVEALVLVARNQERMKNLREEIMLIPHSTPNITCTDNIKEAVKQSDIVVISTNTPLEFLSVKDLNPGCVVCDVSVPHNISREDANNADVLIIDGGLVQCPNEVDFDYLDLPKGVGYACLSEVMILALEGIYENYSTGGDISIFKISEINRLAAKHGFKLAEFRSFGVSVTEDQIEKVIKARQRRIIV